jgi:hypothetical protein
MSEPLVDTVDMKAVVTDPTAVMSLDLYTVQSSNLTFAAPFTLNVRRNDFIHALIAWFDIEFTKCHKPIKFSTGPHTKYTHWKQTVFYLHDVLTVEEGEQVSGVLENKPNAKNKRDLDIRISYVLETDDLSRQAQGSSEYKMYVSKNPSFEKIKLANTNGTPQVLTARRRWIKLKDGAWVNLLRLEMSILPPSWTASEHELFVLEDLFMPLNDVSAPTMWSGPPPHFIEKTVWLRFKREELLRHLE